MKLALWPSAILFGLCLAPAGSGDDGTRLLRIDHYVQVRSTVPAIAEQSTQIYFREVVEAGTALRGGPAADRVALFIHGAGTPGEVSFDVPYQDYSWMAYLARAGFDVFAMDMTGYGRSTRPAAMNDPCNLAPAQQAAYVPALIPAPCAASYPYQMTTLASDWHDIDAVVDRIRTMRHVEKLSLLGWSQGGPRSGGYAAQHADKVARMVLLAPAYNRAAKADPPAHVPASGAAMNTQSRAEFIANWDRQVGCADQYDPAARDSVWSELLHSDPVGASWGAGVRRAPLVTSWGWTTAVVGKTQIPTLLVSGSQDKQVNPDRVKELYSDLGSPKKVFVDLACSSHNAMWEKNHLLLFKASLEWLTQGSVEGKPEGMLRLGY
ncbi:MAG TPA: alpha/beta fold hydrolase [Bryobacteraceae bacterium]|nr:alpha/beta fold hydrolase [Bryobacteraceae bacterium]